jgi:DNA (cytosine-5)-methyltransferase 1
MIIPLQRPPVLRLHREDLIVDSFAGCGGASLGIEWATGRSPDIAVNHDPEAIAMHAANHPKTRHFCESVWDVDPTTVCDGRRVGLAWFSPDCTSHSRAKGGKPVSNKSRGLAWIVIKWARAVQPRVIMLENVLEWLLWGPLDENDRPNPLKEGITFRRWLKQLQNCGYVVEMRELSGMDYGAPTSRKRLFIVARSDGLPIVWPEPTHGPGRAHPYRVAAECLDWSLPCPSIFLSKKESRPLRIKRPLAEKTMRRVGRGVWRYVLNAADPFIVPVTHGGDDRVHSIREPFRTITGAHRGEFALACPTLIQQSWGERPGQAPRILDLQKPLGTIVAGGIKHAVVAAFLKKYKDGFASAAAGSGLAVASEHAFASQIVKLHGTCRDGQPVSVPLPTIRAKGTHLAEVRAFLAKYHGDEGPRTDMPFVMIGGEPYVIVDIGLRMLIARELFRGQGFPDTFQISPKYDDEVLTKEAQVRMVGNSVCPPLAAALVAANFAVEQRRSAVA